jgi:signal transduction histidine kinase
METVRILLIDTSPTFKKLLEATTSAPESVTFEVTVLEPRTDEARFDDAGGTAASRSFRERGVQSPIFVLTKQTEAGVPRSYQRAGVDDMLSVADMNTPLFLWTFMSTLRQAETKRKAKEFDVLQNRLKSANQTLAFITHEINNPLSVIRLALYHLEAPEISPARRDMLFRMLTESVDKMNTQLDQLRAVRRILANGAPGRPAAHAPVLHKQQAS